MYRRIIDEGSQHKANNIIQGTYMSVSRYILIEGM